MPGLILPFFPSKEVAEQTTLKYVKGNINSLDKYNPTEITGLDEVISDNPHLSENSDIKNSASTFKRLDTDAGYDTITSKEREISTKTKVREEDA